MEAQNILNYRKQQRNRLRGHSLATHRRCFLLDFHNNVHQACLMMNEQKPNGTIADLWQPLKRIRAALKDLRLVEANDDTRPVADRELPRKLLMEKTDCNPRQIWLQIKLGYTKICLEILVQILKYIYPERIDYWIDAEEDCKWIPPMLATSMLRPWAVAVTTLNYKDNQSAEKEGLRSYVMRQNY